MERFDAIILRWFSGKGAVAAVHAFTLMVESEAAEYWIPGASRKVRAALNKQNVAAKRARAAGIRDYAHPLYSGMSDMQYGSIGRAARHRTVQVASSASIPDHTAAAMLREWAADWAPIAARLDALDARRPKPTVVLGTLSPTVIANVAGTLGLALASVTVPPMRGEWREVTRQRKGCRPGEMETVKIWHVEIEWPANTRHCRSKFSYGSHAGNSQCEACGHAIRDIYNWCPLMLIESDGVPSSLWVGKDCARKLLGSDVVDSGEAIYARTTGIAASPGIAGVTP
jgi:hypothetical protein